MQAALKVRRSKAATAALHNHPQPSIEQAAELTRFEADEEAYQELMDTVVEEPGELDNRLAEWRQEYRLRGEREVLSRTLREEGVTVLDPSLPSDTLPLNWLRTSRSDTTLLNSDPHAHASVQRLRRHRQLRQLPRDHRRHLRVRRWKDHGHVDIWSSESASAGTTGKSPQEKIAKRARVIRNNKAWTPAAEVHRTRLKTLLASDTPPKQTDQFIALTLINGTHELRTAMERHHRLACELLGLK